MHYANIIFDGNRNGSVNIGDDLQILAIEHMYRKMGIEYDQVVRIPFSKLSNYDGEYVILPISFPMYGYRKDIYITMFSSKIIPVFLGLSIMSGNILPEEIVYLRRWQPILCRDYRTVELLRNKGIEAYVNGCMTLTLSTDIFSNQVKRIDPKKIFLVDVANKYLEWIPNNIRDVAIERTQILHECNNPEEAMKEVLQDYYENAALVITTRLHSAMPCIALGIPVIVIKDKYSFRFTTLSKYVPVYTEKNHNNIDWNPNPADLDGMQEKVLELGIWRVTETYQKYNMICDISDWYENQDIGEEVFVEHFDNVKQFIEWKWQDKNADIKYGIWGITQKSDLICTYFEDNYPNAKFVTAYDRNKKVKFHNIDSTSDINELLDKDSFIFVTAATANEAAIEFFDNANKKDYYISSDGVMDKKIQMKEVKIYEDSNK